MSFAHTLVPLVTGKKDVTRRTGWRFLKAGTHVCAVKKSMGLKPGEKMVTLGVCDVVKVSRVRLDRITKKDVIREGFPEFTRAEFVHMFVTSFPRDWGGRITTPETIITRIEFKFRPACVYCRSAERLYVVRCADCGEIHSAYCFMCHMAFENRPCGHKTMIVQATNAPVHRR